MAAAIPIPTNIIFLHDVDNNLIREKEDGKDALNASLLDMVQTVQKDLLVKGVAVRHHLFTAREIVVTLKYIGLDYYRDNENWRHSINALQHTVAKLQEYGLIFDDTPVLQIYDAISERALGDTFREELIKQENYLLTEGVSLYEKVRENGWFKINPKSQNWLLDEWIGGVVDCITDKVPKKVDALNVFKSQNPACAPIWEASEKDVANFEKLKQEGIKGKKKTHLLAKVFTNLLAKHGTNFVIIWTDDRSDLYDDARRSDNINGIPLKDLMDKHLIFIHTPGEVTKDYYLHQLIEAVHSRASLSHCRDLFPRPVEPGISTPLYTTLCSADGPIGAMPKSSNEKSEAYST